MIASMTKYSFVLLNGTQEELLTSLQEIGLVDITRSIKPIDEASQNLKAEIELLDGLIRSLKKADIPEGTVPEFIDGDIVRLAGGMLMRYSDDTVEIKQLQSEISDLRQWGQFDAEVLGELARAGVPVHFHKLSTKAFKPEWAQEYALTVVSQDKSHTLFVVAGPDTLPGEIPAPTIGLAAKEKELQEKQAHFAKVLSRIASAKERIPELEEKRAQLYSQLDLHLAGAAAVPAAEDTIVTLVGYAPTESDAAVTEALNKTGVFYLKEAAAVEDNPPIQLKNNWFVRQFELLTDMYGRPDYNEFDPTPYISVFFLLFFAMCMGDAGYGLALVIGGILLRKTEMKDMAPLVTILGVGTFVVGIVMHTSFGVDIAVLPWIPAWLKSVMITGTIAGFEA
ncbi:MAG: hypothetical protein IKI85_06155, partial [Bacteroidales bacterium]|nr:hypothetical protein [Bacteroidales bacterium]